MSTSTLTRSWRLRSYDNRSIAASGFGLLVTLVTQVLSLPVFAKGFGLHVYADWLLLSAAPAYLALSDLGFANAAATAITHAIANGRAEEAKAEFRSCWLATTLLGMIAIIPVIAIASAVDIAGALGLTATTASSARIVLIVLMVQVLVGVQAGFIEAAMRGIGEFPRGVLTLAGLRLADFVAAAAGALIWHSVVTSASLMLATRLTLTAVALSEITRRGEIALFGVRGASLGRARALLWPSLAYLGFPMGNMMSNQIVTLVVGRSLGPAAVVDLSAVRVLCGLIRQVNNVVLHGIQPALTEAVAQRRPASALRTYRKGQILSYGSAASALVLLAMLGPEITAFWSGGESTPNRLFVVLMALTVAADTPYLSAMVVATTMNQHGQTARWFLIGTAASLVALTMTISAGLWIVPCSMFLIDAFVTLPAIRSSRRIFRAISQVGLVDSSELGRAPQACLADQNGDR